MELLNYNKIAVNLAKNLLLAFLMNSFNSFQAHFKF
jgi:hypothetical protein